MNQTAKVAVLMGSRSDFPKMKPAAEVLGGFGIPCETRVLSAHRLPDEVASFARSAEEKGYGVLIAGAGMAAHLAGVLAAHTVLPVIGVPLASGALNGADALYATVQMPKGIPVATVAIDGAANAAYLAAEILALSDAEIRRRLHDYRRGERERLLAEKIDS